MAVDYRQFMEQNPDLVRQALAASGGDPTIADQILAGGNVPPLPAAPTGPTEIPQQVQGAEQPPVAPVVAEAAPEAPLGAPEYHGPKLKGPMGQYRQDQMADDQLKIEGGVDWQNKANYGVQAQSERAQAEVLGKKERSMADIADKTQKRVDDENVRQKRFTEDADKTYEQYKSLLQQQPKGDVFAKVLGLIGMVARAGGNGALGAAMSGIGGMIGSDTERLAFLQQAKGKELGAAMDMLKSSEGTEEHEARMGANLMNIHAVPYDVALDRVKKEFKGTELESLAARTQLEMREEIRNKYVGWYKEAERQRAAGAGANARNVMAGMTEEELARVVASQGPNAATARAEIERRAKLNLDLEDKQSTIDERRGKAVTRGTGTVDRDVSNPDVWRSAGDTEKAKFRTADAAMKSFKEDATKLDKLLEEHGTEAYGDVAKEMEALAGNLAGSYKEIKELGSLDNGVIAMVEKTVGDPTAFWRGGAGVRKKLKTTVDSLERSVETKAEGLGLSRPRDARSRTGDPVGPRGGQPGPAVDPNAPVGMIDNTGRLRPVHPSRVEGLRQQGWRTQGETAPSYEQPKAPPPRAPTRVERDRAAPSTLAVDPELSDAEYEEQVRRESGY